MYKYLGPKRSLGFTLIEVIVVAGIVAILASVAGINAVEFNKRGRDAKRQADLRSLQSAIELYKNKNGSYPVQCPPANPVAADGWSGQLGTDYACADGTNNYIQGVAPEFISVLPSDKKLNGSNSGYVYRSNGLVYKIKAQRTVEAAVIDYSNPLKACDVRVASTVTGSLVSGSTQREVIGWCGRVFPSDNLPLACKTTDPQWRNSYGLWGGFAAKRTVPVDPTGSVTSIVQDTTNVICK